MKTLLAKVTSAAAGTLAVLVALALAGLGFTALIYLALIGLVGLGLGLLAAPFVAVAQKRAEGDRGQADLSAS